MDVFCHFSKEKCALFLHFSKILCAVFMQVEVLLCHIVCNSLIIRMILVIRQKAVFQLVKGGL